MFFNGKQMGAAFFNGKQVGTAFRDGKKVFDVTMPPFHPLDLNPLAWWAFDGDLTDKSGNGYNLTSSTTPAYEPDGVNGYAVRYNTVNVTNSQFLASGASREVSLCWWTRQRVAMASLQYGAEHVALFGVSVSPSQGTVMRFNRNQNVNATNPLNNGIAAWANVNLASTQISFDGFVTPVGVWTHLTIVVGEVSGADRVVRLYADGVLVKTGVLNAAFLSTAMLTACTFTQYGCDWCDMMIFKKALTAAEVTAIYEWRK